MMPLSNIEGFTEEQLADPVFRLTCGKIYQIRNQDGEPEWFQPKPEQKRIIRLIYLTGVKVLIIPKARQLGMSTLIALIVLDTILWSTSVQTTLIDYNGDNARKKMVEKVIYAYDRLPPAIAALTSVRAKNTQTGEFAVGPNVDFCSEEDAKMRSTAFFGDQPRGGTNQILWLSEWAEIAARFPQRSTDIKTGALSSAKRGLIIIETTWHGGKRGDVWPFVKAALETPPEHRTNRTPAIQFFAWWTDPGNRQEGSPEAVRPETLAYFTEVKRMWPQELDGIEFSHEQMLWYQEESIKLGVYMRGQNPTVLEECFESIIRGAIWAEAIAKCRQEGRITNVPHDPTLEVDTFWDLGAPANTAIKFVQHRGPFHHLIASQQGGWTFVPDLVRGLKLRGYKYHIHFLPHDGAQTDRGGATFEQQFRDELAKQGVSGQIVVIPRAGSVWPGINQMTAMFNRLLIDISCKEFIDAAQNYRRRPDPLEDDRYTDDIVKDWTNHECVDGKTLIETQRGPVPIREMTTADKVRLGDVLADVEYVGPTKFSEVLELEFDDGTKLLASPRHWLFTTCGLARCDTIGIMRALWTPEHPQFHHLSQSKQIRAAFHELSTASHTGSTQNAECGLLKWVVKAASFIATFMRCVMALNWTAKLKLCQSVAGMILQPKTGFSAQNARGESRRESIHSSFSTARTTALSQIPGTTAPNIQSNNASIVPSGNITTAQSPTASMSTTRTKTKRTTTFPISSYLHEVITCAFMDCRTHGLSAAAQATCCEEHMFSEKQQRGTLRQKVAHGISRMASRLWQNALSWIAPARFAEASTRPNGLLGADSALHYAKCENVRDTPTKLKPESAFGVKTSSLPESAKSKRFAQANAVRNAPHGSKSSGVKIVVKIRRLPPRQLYDMTVKHHHCYVANGVLISNCDSIRYMAEADMLGHLPGQGASVAIKPYFDPGSLKDASALAASTPPHLFNLVCSDRPGYPIRHVSGLPHPYGGWLRVWDNPRPGHSYVLTLIGRSLQMWRCDSQESPLFLAASPNWATLVDFGIIYRLAAQLSAYYGLAPIALDVISHPGGVRELEALGANIIARSQLEGRRPVGQEEPTEHAGWEWKPEVEQHAMVLLQTRVRQSRIVLNCPSLIAQCSEVTNSNEGRPESRDIVAVDLVHGAALACATHDFGSSYRAPMLETAQGVGYGAGQPSSSSGRMRNR